VELGGHVGAIRSQSATDPPFTSNLGRGGKDSVNFASTELTGEVVSTSSWVAGLFIGAVVRLAVRDYGLHCSCMVTM
jgi:hypothetical protein